MNDDYDECLLENVHASICVQPAGFGRISVGQGNLDASSVQRMAPHQDQ